MNEMLKPLYEYEIMNLNNLYDLSDHEITMVKELVEVLNELGEDLSIIEGIENLLQLTRSIEKNRDFTYLAIWLQSKLELSFDYERFIGIYDSINRYDFYEINDYIIYTEDADLEVVFSEELER